MRRRPKDESNKVSDIPIPHATSNPWTVMIMHLYTSIAVGTMESSWWSQEITCLAVAQLVPSSLYNFLIVFIEDLRHKLELLKVVIHLNVGGALLLLELEKLVFAHVRDEVVLSWVGDQLVWFYLSAGYDARVGPGGHEVFADGSGDAD